MSPDITKQKICPSCGSRVSNNATRCLVCGRNLAATADSQAVSRTVRGPRFPEITLNLPIALGLMVLILGVGAGTVFAVLNSTGRVSEPTPTVTVTLTPTSEFTPTVTLTPTIAPTFTPLPPLEYKVVSMDTCLSIAAFFEVSAQSIVLLNNLPPTCNNLVVGQTLLVPQPTPTASPMPSVTLSVLEATEAACEKINYTVTANDTISGIARSYNISIQTLKDYNGLATDIVYQGQPLIIPLCERLPTPGPTPTATLPPPYLGPNLLLPNDGTSFMALSDIITLQWASVGTLRENESYEVTVEDVTDGTGKIVTDYVTDTKLIVPSSLRPTDTRPHIFRWIVTTVRQSGSTQDGKPVWQSAGAQSTSRTFSWWAAGVATPTP